MTKVALLSDIHANSLALKHVVSELISDNISTLLIAGDFVGYYYNCQEVFDLLSPFDVVACKGNHEVLFDDWLSGNEQFQAKLIEKYGHGLMHAENTLSTKQKNWLKSLPHKKEYRLEGLSILICHGSPWDINQYLYENTLEQHSQKFKDLEYEYDMVIIGHSHYQFGRKMGCLTIVNPGSVGQPRSGKVCDKLQMARAQWAVLNLPNKNVEFKTTRYESSMLFEEVRRNDPSNNYLTRVLNRS